MSGESWAEYVEQKERAAIVDDTKETAFKAAGDAMKLGINVDTFVGMMKASAAVGMADKGIEPAQAAAANFLVESWIREAYERAGKGDEKE